MIKRIFSAFTIIILFLFATCIGLFLNVQYDYFTSLNIERLISKTKLISNEINTYGVEYIANSKSDEDMYIFDYQKNLLYSSNQSDDTELITDSITNINQKEEFKTIKLDNNSAIYNEYICIKTLDNGKILVVKESQSSILKLMIEMTYPIIIILLLSVLLSIVLSYKVSEMIVKPLNNINLDEPLNGKVYIELEPMVRKLEKQSNKLKRQEFELQYKRDEFEIVTENLSEGLILINISGNILSINKAAAEIFDIKKDRVLNIEEIELNSDLYHLIHNAYSGKKGEAILDFITGKYQVDVNPVISENTIAGVVVLIFDVTEKENSEKMRREFSANVSHELKTPLQSISGYAELLKHGMVKSEDTEFFGSKIYSEAHRMINLVEDIIHLSRLDEGAGEMPYANVNLLEISRETADNLKQEAENMNVSLQVEGDNVEIIAIPHLVSGIIFNLCDNAIKYNKQNGKVLINVKKYDMSAVVSVTDTGIGIPKEDHARIFERFYRVDKSHSKEVGGTGLGLSIVKHAAIIHNAKIDLKSTLGVGTTVSVSFPV